MRRFVVMASMLLLAACQVTLPVMGPGVVVPRPSGSVADVFADVDASPAASPSPVALASPAPLLETGNPLDVAITGPGGFALALVAEPRELEHVRLTRRGNFRWARVRDAEAKPWWRLESEDGLPVLGYELASDAPDPLPQPGEGRSFYAAYWLDGGRYRPQIVLLDANANPLPAARYDYRGLIRLARGFGELALPVDDTGRSRALFLAVARPVGDATRVAIADDLRVGWLEGP
ncbi:MAG: hypothetical protein JWM80_2258 [Cyanobacteria bacterium RYN_339]|nr:hypothetical protein [Cyanobacteria bacterium RYN_339]